MARIIAVAMVALISAAAAPAAAPPGAGARCGVPDLRAQTVVLRTADGIDLAAAVMGKGKTALVLAPEYANDLCSWIPEARVLSAAGFRVVAMDLRCMGYSTCDQASYSHPRYDRDVLAAAAWARRTGSSAVGIVGAGFAGGVGAIVAASHMKPVPFAVGLLSAPSLQSLGVAGYLDPEAAARQLRASLLIVAAKGDISFARDARHLYQEARNARSRQLLLVAGGSHGVGILGESAGARRVLLRFLKAKQP